MNNIITFIFLTFAMAQRAGAVFTTGHHHVDALPPACYIPLPQYLPLVVTSTMHNGHATTQNWMQSLDIASIATHLMFAITRGAR